MIIQKLRLEKGWSQQLLAEMSGLSTRTIQRIENGRTASVESIKSLAAVFEVDFTTLQGALEMNQAAQLSHTPATPDNATDNALQLDGAEQFAYEKVRRIKSFYASLLIFGLVLSGLLILNLLYSPDVWWVQWVFLGWGIGILVKALKTFDWLPLFNPQWEKRQVEKYLRRNRDLP